MKSTSVAVKVDEDQSPLPHVWDIKTGTKLLVDTGAEVSIVRPTRIDQSFKSYDRSLFAAIGGQYRGTFLVPVPSVLLWYWYRGTLLFFGGTGTLVLFYFLVGILRT